MYCILYTAATSTKSQVNMTVIILLLYESAFMYSTYLFNLTNVVLINFDFDAVLCFVEVDEKCMLKSLALYVFT